MHGETMLSLFFWTVEWKHYTKDPTYVSEHFCQ